MYRAHGSPAATPFMRADYGNARYYGSLGKRPRSLRLPSDISMEDFTCLEQVCSKV